MAYLPWAGNLQSDGVGSYRQAAPGDGDGPGGSGPPAGRQSRAEGADPGAFGQAISNHLFSAGLDLHFALATLNDGPGRDRLAHAITEIDDAIRDLRHLMVEITERLAWPSWLLTLPLTIRPWRSPATAR